MTLPARIACLSALPVLLASSNAADHPQWGERHSRNMVSAETGLPSTINLGEGGNVKWTAYLGSDSYSTPSIANGRVLIGANNARPRDERHQGDRAVLLCLDEADGAFNWQLIVPRIAGDRYKDWPRVSMCAAPSIEGNLLYTMTNRFEIVCLDLDGQADGNDGPYKDEGRHMAPADEDAMEVTPIDADIVWLFDMLKDAGTYPHDSAHGSVLIDGDLLYVNTSNGKDNTHRRIRRPDGPSLIVLDKKTGRLVARDRENIGPRIFHSTWSPPALGTVGGQRLIFFCGGDGVVYAFRALEASGPPDTVKTLERVWRFDCDPTAPKENVSDYMGNRDVSPSNIKSTPVFHDGKVYVTFGGDIWWGKNKAWLACIDATKTGEITEAGKLWIYDLNRHCCSTPAVHDGMVFVADCGGILHCVDAATGKAHWTHQLGRDVWGSTLVADGKVYIGTRKGEFWIFAASKEKKVLCETEFPDPIYTTPVAANGVLYVATRKQLYAIEDR
jgi:outer membrane protein assembly factor BamB